MAYCYNEDTEEIELVNQADGDSETVMKAAGTKKNRRDYPTPKLKRKNYLSKSNSSGWSQYIYFLSFFVIHCYLVIQMR